MPGTPLRRMEEEPELRISLVQPIHLLKNPCAEELLELPHAPQCQSFGKVQLQNKNRPLRLLALMNIFKSPSKTVLDGSGFEKPILIQMDTLQNHLLQSVGKKFSQKLQAGISQRNGPEIIGTNRREHFWN